MVHAMALRLDVRGSCSKILQRMGRHSVYVRTHRLFDRDTRIVLRHQVFRPSVRRLFDPSRTAVRALLLLIAFASFVQGEPVVAPTPKTEWLSIFDGESLQGWEITRFGGEGDVYVEDECLMLDFGETLTGVTYKGEALPCTDYEIRLEAQRIEGSDFFCGLTFPVNDAHLTLIVGGWGGALVGLSSLDGEDASRNESRRTIAFRKQAWYPIRIRVTKSRVQVWIEEREVIDQSLVDRQLSLRPEVALSKPLGIASWQTRAALRGIELRRLAKAASPKIDE